MTDAGRHDLHQQLARTRRRQFELLQLRRALHFARYGGDDLHRTLPREDSAATSL